MLPLLLSNLPPVQPAGEAFSCDASILIWLNGLSLLVILFVGFLSLAIAVRDPVRQPTQPHRVKRPNPPAHTRRPPARGSFLKR